MLSDSSELTKQSSWRPWQTVLLVVAVFVASQALTGILLYGGLRIFAIATHADGGQVDTWLESTLAQFMAVGLSELLVILGLVGLLKRHKLSLRALGFKRRPRWRDVIFAALAFASYSLLLAAWVYAIQQFIPNIDSGKQDIGFDEAHGALSLVLVFVSLVVFAPIAEEILFRGFLFGNLRQRWSWLPAALLTSLIFGAAHLAGGSDGWSAPLWTAGLDTLLLSLALCYLREKTGTLWAGICLHMIKNGLAFVLIFVTHSNL